MKSVIVSHKNCPDGAASVLFARVIFPGLRGFFSNHDDINEKCLKLAKALDTEGTMLITDICCDRETLEEIFEILKAKYCKVEIYDHHISMSWLRDVRGPEGFDPKIIFDDERCGSKIFFDEHVSDYPQLEKYQNISDGINDRDLWINENETGVLLSNLHQVYDDHLFVERLLINSSVELQEKEKVLFDYQKRQDEKRIRNLLKNIRINTDKRGFKYGVINGHGQSSDILDRAIHEKDLEYALLLNLNDKRAHIRSKGNLDCAKYAVKLGGGGHQCAAGFPLDFKEPIF